MSVVSPPEVQRIGFRTLPVAVDRSNQQQQGLPLLYLPTFELERLGGETAVDDDRASYRRALPRRGDEPTGSSLSW